MFRGLELKNSSMQDEGVGSRVQDLGLSMQDFMTGFSRYSEPVSILGLYR